MRTLVTVVLLAGAVGLGGCVVAPPARPPEALESAPLAPPPEQVTEVVAYPAQGQASPEDLAATMFEALGISHESEIRDSLGRPLSISRGKPIQDVLA